VAALGSGLGLAGVRDSRCHIVVVAMVIMRGCRGGMLMGCRLWL
jgi:hypothetical protein